MDVVSINKEFLLICGAIFLITFMVASIGTETKTTSLCFAHFSGFNFAFLEEIKTLQLLLSKNLLKNWPIWPVPPIIPTVIALIKNSLYQSVRIYFSSHKHVVC